MAEAKKVEIKAQKPKRAFSPEEQAIYDRIQKDKQALTAIRDKKKAEHAEIRKAELGCVWIIFRFVQAELRKGNKNVIEMLNALGSSLAPSETKDAAQVEAEKNALRIFIKANTK